MNKPSLLTCAAFAALSLTLAPLAASAGTGQDARDEADSVEDVHTLWSQMQVDMGLPYLSQNFESVFDIYDIQIADDFKVPKAHDWIVEEVDVVGQYVKGEGPPRSEQVTFYADAGGLPGSVIADYEVVGTRVGSGSFKMRIPKTTLKPGVYWLSVVANMDLGAGGTWGWEQKNFFRLNHRVHRNPGGGWGICLSWCSDGIQGDAMFALKGRERPSM